MKPAFLRRGTRYACRTLRNTVRFARDTSFGTCSKPEPGEVIRLINRIERAALLPHKEALLALADLTLQHRFDLLGSGWTELPVPKPAALNRANRQNSRALQSQIDPEYRAFDWHCDFKSGYRWNQRTWHRHVRFGNDPGVDVKVPWELARMQHLPRLALAYGLNPDARYTAEFRNEVLDFGAHNPPRFGVNWYCAMDVAIRLTNWLVAYDLFRSFGAEFDSQFRATLTRMVLEHSRYVRANLERNGKVRNNHYLAGIAGLVFACRYLPCTLETQNWLRFATGELIREVRHQFHPDGSNFEGSTSYHRLSGEMVIFATAVLTGLPQPPELPAWYLERLARMADFTRALQTPTGAVPQIGDNDSGRFLHLTPMYRKLPVAEARARYVHLRRYDARSCPDYWDFDDQNHSHLLQAADGLLNPAASPTLEGLVVRGLARGASLAAPRTERVERRPALEIHAEPEGHAVDVCGLKIGSSPVTHQAFPDFGVYLFSNSQFFLAIRCGGTRGTHAHDDHLSIELHYRGEVLFRDPGTLSYTPHPSLRRLYRSLAAHSVPYPLEEGPKTPVFQAIEAGRSECVFYEPNYFLGLGHYGANRQAYREVRIENGTLRIRDFLNTGTGADITELLPYSPGYGKLSNEWVRAGRTQNEELSQCVC